ncbi:MAG TPA: DUF4168 domain-containing protein [Alkalispirochaeta sp.]|nr:DUF4168 domain-containing protein [Alkalispirochaeta sp.]
MRNSNQHTYHFGFLARFVVALGVIALMSAPVVAQMQSQGSPEVSDQELESFVAALQEVQAVQQDMATQSQESVQSSDMGEERFQELYQARQSGSQPANAATDAENQEFEQLMADIQSIQQESNAAMVEAVEEEGLQVQRFNEIAQAVQQNQNLMQRIQEMAGDGSS